MITASSLKHPTMTDKILNAVIQASEHASANKGHGKTYIANGKGNNIMRLDVFKPGIVDHLPKGGVIVYGESSRQITKSVEQALGYSFSDIL